MFLFLDYLYVDLPTVFFFVFPCVIFLSPFFVMVHQRLIWVIWDGCQERKRGVMGVGVVGEFSLFLPFFFWSVVSGLGMDWGRWYQGTNNGMETGFGMAGWGGQRGWVGWLA